MVVGWGQYTGFTAANKLTSIHMQRVNPDGSENGAQLVLPAASIAGSNFTPDLSAIMPKLSMDASGNFVVGWQSVVSDTYLYNNLYAQAYLASGEKNGTPVELASSPYLNVMSMDGLLRPIVLQETYAAATDSSPAAFGLQAQLFSAP